MARMKFGARDDPAACRKSVIAWIVRDRIGILKGCEPYEPCRHRGWQTGPVDVELDRRRRPRPCRGEEQWTSQSADAAKAPYAMVRQHSRLRQVFGRPRPDRCISASPTIADTASAESRGNDDRNAHWSSYGRSSLSTNTLLPCSRAFRCRGKAIRLPKPPTGIVSWLGNKRSYDAKPISGRCSIVSVRIAAPSCRAVRAGIGSEKKIQTWPPLPERDRSRAAGTPFAWHVSIIADASAAQLALSKSAARNQQVSSGSSG